MTEDWGEAAKWIGGATAAIVTALATVPRYLSKNRRNIAYDDADSSFVKSMRDEMKELRKDNESMRQQLGGVWQQRVAEAQNAERLMASNDQQAREIAHLKERVSVLESALKSSVDEIDQLRKKT